MNSMFLSTTVCPSDSDLKAYFDGELSPVRRLRVRRHLQTCAACAEAAQANTLLGTEVRRWRTAQAPPPALRQRILSRLTFAPEASPGLRREGKQRTALRWAGVSLVTAALVLWLVLAPQGQHGRLQAATIRQALQGVNTWHLSGWKLVEGKRVSWEVWGRRSPFFYRERLGEQIIQDDGAERVQVFPPDPALWRPTGLVVKTSSRPGDNAENKGLDFVTRYAVWPDNMMPWRETRDQVVFNENDAGMQGPGTVTDNLYTVDKQTALPVQIEVRRGNNRTPDRLTSESLTAEYDVPLPDAGAAPQPPSYQILDATRTAPASSLPRENATRANGITVQVMPLGEDADGNVLVNVHAWLGGVLLATPHLPLFAFAEVLHNLGGRASSLPAVHDDQGRGYVGVELQDGPPNQIADDRLIVLSPLEPLPPQAQRPRRLALTLRVAPAIRVAVSGMKGTASSQTLLDEHIVVLVSLPDDIKPFDGSRLHGMSEEPLDAVIAMAHADYWINDFDWKDPSDLMRLKGLRSIAWRKKALQLLPPGNRDAPLEHERLLQAYDFMADRYHHLGDRRHATEALRAIIAESNQPPAVPHDFRKRTEEELRDWTNPGAQ
jgi:hypothetical protein